MSGKEVTVVDEKELRLRKKFTISQQRVQAVMMEYKVDNRDQQRHSRTTDTFTKKGDEVNVSDAANEGVPPLNVVPKHGSPKLPVGRRGSIAVGFECLELQGLLQSYVKDLHRIFCHYSAADASSTDDSSTMSTSEWLMLMKDIKIFDNRLRQVHVSKIFGEADHNRDVEDMNDVAAMMGPKPSSVLSSPEEGTLTTRGMRMSPGSDVRGFQGQGTSGEDDDVFVDPMNPDGELVAHEFVEALVRLAVRKFNTGGGLMQRVKLLLDKHLLPFACRAEPDLFHNILSKEEVRTVMQLHTQNLIRVYQHYSAHNIHKSAISKGTMDFQDLLKFCRDCSMFEGSLTEQVLSRIFNLINQVEGAETEPNGDIIIPGENTGSASPDLSGDSGEGKAVAISNNELVYR